MDNLWRVRTLTTAINEIFIPEARLINRLFGNKKRQLTDLYAIEIYTEGEGILDNLRVHEALPVVNHGDRKVITLQAPRFGEKSLIPAARLNEIRRFGTTDQLVLLQDEIAKELGATRRRFDRTREFMGARSLSGKVISKKGVTLVDYNLPEANQPVLTGDDLWTNENSKPVAKIRLWKKMIENGVGGVTEWVAYAGFQAMNALIENESALELMKYQSGTQIAETGRIARLAGVNIEEYNGSYIDDSGVRHAYIPETHFILIGMASDVFAEYWCPPIDLAAEGGVGSGQTPEIFFAKSWEEEDPSGRWLKGEGRPLPVLQRPKAVIYAQVVED